MNIIIVIFFYKIDAPKRETLEGFSFHVHVTVLREFALLARHDENGESRDGKKKHRIGRIKRIGCNVFLH